jgi:hypothetical protein
MQRTSKNNIDRWAHWENNLTKIPVIPVVQDSQFSLPLCVKVSRRIF